MDNYLEKELSDLLQSPIPTGSRKRMVNTWLITSRCTKVGPFLRPKKSAICAEYSMSSKFYLSKWKTYFSHFTDKFLKFEEVGYLIHYVKFKMWPALFYVNSRCFPNSSIDWKLRFLNVGVRL